MSTVENIRFDERGLVPAIIQDEKTNQVLMLAYMNEESLKKTLETGYTWFFSRSRKGLWHKGETSGHVQQVKSLYYDCDADTLLVKVEQTGVACHEGTFSCFTYPLVKEEAEKTQRCISQVLEDLYQVIEDRKQNPKEGSYTNYLFDKGQDKILKKVGEEAAETLIASKNQSKEELLYEMADLWYHCLVLLSYHNVTTQDLLSELQGRKK